MRRSAALLLGLSLLSCGRHETVASPLEVGRSAPAYSAQTLAGDMVRVGVGEPLALLNFWATWCIPCRREFPTLEQLQRDYGARGLRVLAVSVDEGGEGLVRQFVALRQVSFGVGMDDSGRAQRLFQMVGLPESFLIDNRGVLRHRQIGAIPPDAADLRATIESVLGEAGPPPSATGRGSRSQAR